MLQRVILFVISFEIRGFLPWWYALTWVVCKFPANTIDADYASFDAKYLFFIKLGSVQTICTRTRHLFSEQHNSTSNNLLSILALYMYFCQKATTFFLCRIFAVIIRSIAIIITNGKEIGCCSCVGNISGCNVIANRMLIQV